jgi:hypothetical protein
MSKETKHNRRRFLGTAAMSLAAAQFGMFRSAEAQSRKAEPADVPPIKPGTNTSFGSLKQVDASVLNVGYAEAGPTDGPVVILLHGWPYDIHSYFDNPDHVSIVIHNYRWRLGLAEGEPKYDDLERRLAEGPVITVPTITLEGDAMVPHIRTPVPMPRNSRANTRTGSSRAVSVTICLRKPRRPSPKL